MHSDASGAGFQPLAPLLQATTPETLDAARLRVAAFDRVELLNGFRSAFASGKRIRAFLLSEELTKRGIPPCFRLHGLSATDYSTNQKFDLMLYDFRWLRHAHRHHTKQVRYVRYREMLTVGDVGFHRAAEYAFYQGKRPAWKIVASLSMTEAQQWDCIWLRSTPIAKRHAAMCESFEGVLLVLQDDLRTVRRTKSFTDDDANATLRRRHALWVCSQMTGGSPTETAARYGQLTGEEITRHVAARQLQIVGKILTEKRLTESNKI